MELGGLHPLLQVTEMPNTHLLDEASDIWVIVAASELRDPLDTRCCECGAELLGIGGHPFMVALLHKHVELRDERGLQLV